MADYMGDGGTALTKRDKYRSRWGMLKSERSSWWGHWQDLSAFYMPRRARFFASDRNKGNLRNQNIIDNTATRAVKVLGAGMMSGATSPARPWFRLDISDKELKKYGPVKKWLADTTQVMQLVFQKSNTYRVLHTIYENLGVFGTSGALMVEDFDSIIHLHPLTIGEFAIATNFKGEVETCYREIQKTVHELVAEFGRDQCSNTVRNLYDRGQLDQWVPIIHAIEPRRDRDYRAKDNKNMPWASCYFELGSNPDQYLRESGFKKFPGLVPRWTVDGQDIYGSSPGMDALGDVKQLQHEQLRKGQAIDYQTKPPLQAPTQLKNREADMMPGGVTYVDVASGQNSIKTLFDVNLRLDFLLEDIRDVRERINAAFYADLFLMLANGNNSQMTATEVAERHEEKLLMLGPVLERLHNELLGPLVNNTFDRLVESGILPVPPEELHGQEIEVEFVSMLAQAQRAIGTNSIDRFVMSLGSIAQFKPEVLDKFDQDQWADAYSDMLGVDPTMVVPNDKVAIIRQQRQQAMAQQQQQEAMAQQAKTVRDLSASDTSGQNALTDVLSNLQGYSTPQAGV